MSSSAPSLNQPRVRFDGGNSTTSDPTLFASILPVILEFGPPEVSILAVARDPNAMQDGLGDLVTGIVERTDGMIGGAVCMDFDSGDLVRIL